MPNKKVTPRFLNDLANSIYNPKTKTFLRLCNGTLQNGPDPEDAKRSMHCGLGELYVAMTGRQPDDDGVDEDDVVDAAVALSSLANARKRLAKSQAKAAERVRKSFFKAPVSPEALTNIDYALDKEIRRLGDVAEREYQGDFDGDVVSKFRHILDVIPEKNDDGTDTDVCTPADFKARAKRVATQLRKAARFLENV